MKNVEGTSQIRRRGLVGIPASIAIDRRAQIMKRIMTQEHFENKPISWWDKEKGLYEEESEFMIPLLKNMKPKKILEIGPGRGRLTFIVSKMGHEIHALEINRKFIKYCQEKHKQDVPYFYNGNAEMIPFKDGTFDVVYCMAVFMHFPHPEKVMKEVNRILKKDGSFIFTFLRKYTKGYFIHKISTISGLYKYDLDYRFDSWGYIKSLVRKSNFRYVRLYGDYSNRPCLVLKNNGAGL